MLHIWNLVWKLPTFRAGSCHESGFAVAWGSVDLTTTSGDATGTGVGIMTALAFPLLMQYFYTICFRRMFSPMNTEKTHCGTPVGARYGMSFVDSQYKLSFGFLMLCYFRYHGIFNLLGYIRPRYSERLWYLHQWNDMSYMSHMVLLAKFCILSARCTGNLCEILS